MQYQLTFGQAIQSVFSKYATFTGRASRSEYWWWALFTFIVGFVFNLIGIKILSGIVNLALFLPGLAVLVRRLHDINKSGWWAVLPCLISGVCGGLAACFALNTENSTLGIFTGIAGIVCLVICIVLLYGSANPARLKTTSMAPFPT